MFQRRPIRRAAVIALALAAIGAVPPAVPGGPSVSAQTPGPGAGGEYHTTAGDRIFDSRDSSPINDPEAGPKPAGAAIHVPVLGVGGVPADPADVLAIAVNVTVTQANAAGYAEVYPKGFRAADPTSLINFRAGVDVPNMAIVGVGNDGAITVLPIMPGAANGQIEVLVDVFGWVSKTGYVDAEDTGARLIALDQPFRGYDSRPGTVGPGETIEMQVRGAAGLIPNDPNVTAVVVNLTSDNRQPTSQATFLSATAETAPPGGPTTSSSNVPQGLIKANLAIVPIGADGKIRVYNSAGDVKVIVDVFGYLEKGRDAATYEGRIIPLEFPFRSFDTRRPEWGAVPLGFGSEEEWSFWCFSDSVQVDGVQVGRQTALLGNVTGTLYDRIRPDLPGDTFLTLYPRGERPNTSNINMFENMDVPNMALLSYGDSDPDPDTSVVDPYMIEAYNQNGSLHYILDVFAIVLGEGPAPTPPAGYCDPA